MLLETLTGILVILGWLVLKIVLPVAVIVVVFVGVDILLFSNTDKNNFKR